MLSLLPIIGPIIQGLLNTAANIYATVVKKKEIDADVAKTEIQASTQITLASQSDLGFRLCRDIVMFPGSLWIGLFVEGKIMHYVHPEWVWPVASLDGPLAYLPFALLTYFFGISAMNIWKFGK